MKKALSFVLALAFVWSMSAQTTYTTINDFENGSNGEEVIWSGACSVVANLF